MQAFNKLVFYLYCDKSLLNVLIHLSLITADKRHDSLNQDLMFKYLFFFAFCVAKGKQLLVLSTSNTVGKKNIAK